MLIIWIVEINYYKDTSTQSYKEYVESGDVQIEGRPGYSDR